MQLEKEVERGNLTAVKKIIGTNFVLKCKGLIYACKHGQLSILKYIVNSENNEYAFLNVGKKGLHMAILRGHLSIIEFFVKKGYLTEQDQILVVEKGHPQMLQCILDHVFVNTDRLLDKACEIGRMDMIKEIYNVGAGISYNTIRRTFEKRSFPILKYLLECLFPQHLDDMKSEALKHEDFDFLMYLVQNKIIEKPDNDKFKQYVSTKEIEAQRKIYFWWIKICYDYNRPVGQRMLQRSWQQFQNLCLERN